MKIICAWCQKEGKQGFLGERSPLADQSETHGICWEHLSGLRLTLPPKAPLTPMVGPEPLKFAC